MKEAIELQGIKDRLKLQDIHLTEGGPSIMDPCGLISFYMGFRGQNGTGFWFAVDETGSILKAGATINDQSVEFPMLVKL